MNYEQITSTDIQKHINQIERKREYNRNYYQNKVKPKKELNKKELEILREKCNQLEYKLSQIENDQTIKTQIEELNLKLIEMTNLNEKLKQENCSLQQALDIARQRNYELMIQKANHLLPKLQTLTIS